MSSVIQKENRSQPTLKSRPSLLVMENVENTTLETGNQGGRASEPHNSNSRPHRGRRLPQGKKEQLPPPDGPASNRRNRHPKSEPSNSATSLSEGKASSFVSVFVLESTNVD